MTPATCGTEAVRPAPLQSGLWTEITGAAGAAVTLIDFELAAVPLQESVAVTVRVTVPEDGTVKMMESPMSGEVIVPPPAICHE